MSGSGAEAGATVTLYDTNGTTVLGSAVGGRRRQLVDHQFVAGDGGHTLTAKQTDIAGNVSAASAGLVGDDRHRGGGAERAGPDRGVG